MTSEHPKMSKQGTAGKRKYLTLMISQKIYIIRRPESGERQSEVKAPHLTGLSTIYNIKKQDDNYNLQLSVVQAKL
jgi:hypothetical protein